MMNTKSIIISALSMCLSLSLFSQSESGWYMNWNRDHTERTVKPTIKLDKEESKIMNCYRVSFNEDGKLGKVEFFASGKKSPNSDFGAHILELEYHTGYYEEIYKNVEDERVANSNGVWLTKFYLNEDGYWTRMEYYDREDKLVNQYGVAVSKVQRDYMNRMISEIQLDSNFDTIPDVNDFKVPHFTFNEDGYMSSRQNRNENGQLVNGKYGYAKVVFHLDHNGLFYGEEFIDSQGNLINSHLGYAKIDFRDFNKYGKNKRQYFTDESGYASEGKAMGVITYNENMTRDEILYYDRVGEPTEDFKGRYRIKYIYDDNGRLIKREYYNLSGELVE